MPKFSKLGFGPPVLHYIFQEYRLGPFSTIQIMSETIYGLWAYFLKFCWWALAHFSWKKRIRVYNWCIPLYTIYISGPFWTFWACILFENEFSRFHLYFPYYFRAFVPYARFNSLFLNFTQIRHPCTLNLQFVFFTPIWYKTFVYQCIQVVYRPVLQLSTAEK